MLLFDSWSVWFQHIFCVLLRFSAFECFYQNNVSQKKFYFWNFTVALPVCWLMSVTSEFRSRGASAYSFASLCRIMTSLLKMTSLTPERDSKKSSSCPSRHLGLIWHLAHTELLALFPCQTSFLTALPSILQGQSTFWSFHPGCSHRADLCRELVWWRGSADLNCKC